MFAFGYSNRFNGPLRALIAIAVGIVMVIYNDQAMNIVVKIIAALVFASGIVSLAVGLKRKDDGSSKLMNFNAIVDIVIATGLFVFNDFVAGLIISVLGIVLLGFGIFQIISLLSASRVLRMGAWPFVMPVIVTLAGGFLLFSPDFAESSISLIAGISLFAYGVSELIASWKMKKAINEYEIHRTSESAPAEDVAAEVKDVDYEKVDEQ